MRVAGFLCAALFLVAAAGAAGEKPPDLAKVKFKQLAKYLDLSVEQQAKIRPNVERVQDIVKRAARLPGSGGWRGGYASTGGIGGPGDWGRRPPSTATTGGTAPKEAMAQRQEWQKEIEGRVLEIKSMLTPAQLVKFQAVQIPNIVTGR